MQLGLKYNLHGRTPARSSTKSSIPLKLVTLCPETTWQPNPIGAEQDIYELDR